MNRAYYGTDARAYELLAGAFLALCPGLIRRACRWRSTVVVVAALALLTLVTLSTSVFDLSAVHRGVATTVTTFVLIVAIESARGGMVNRALSSSPAVYLGQISYGTYLWHWPVIVVGLSLTNDHISPSSLFAVSALLATGLASLSFHLVERPIRQGRLLDRMNPVVIGAGLGLALVAALLIVPRVLEPTRAQAATTQLTTTSGFTPIPKIDFARAAHTIGSDLHDVPFLPRWNCEGKPAPTCVIVKGGPESILVIGDSHAQMFFPTFAKIAKDRGLTLETAASAGCPWQRNLYLPSDGLGSDDLFTKECITFKRDLYARVIPQLKPTVVIAISNDYLVRRPGVERDSNGKVLAATGAGGLRQQVETETEQSLQSLTASAGKVLIVEPVPTTIPKDDPFVCLTKGKFVEDCRFVSASEPTELQLMYRSQADNKRIFTADFSKLLCPYDPICDPIVDGIVVRFDNQHMTPLFAESLAPEVMAFMRGAGLISLH